MCDCCDDYYCGGCKGGKDDPVLGGGPDYLYGVTPYVNVTSSVRGLTDASPIVTLAEAKQHCRVDISDDDALIQAYINAAVDYVSGRTGISLGLTKHTVLYSSFPSGKDPIVPPYPNSTIHGSPTDTFISYIATDGNTKILTLGAGGLGIITDTNPSPYIPTSGAWPTDYAFTGSDSSYIRLTYFTSGNGTYFSAGPQCKLAVLMLVAHWYTAREPVTTGLSSQNNTVPYTLDVLLASSADISF